MTEPTQTPPSPFSRRQFLKSSTLVAAATAISFPAILHAQSKQTLNAAIIGVGGRGGGAGKNFLEAAKQVGVDAKVVALAVVEIIDLFLIATVAYIAE